MSSIKHQTQTHGALLRSIRASHSPFGSTTERRVRVVVIMADLRTCVGGVELACCVYNASGPRTGSVDALAKIGASRAGE